RMIDQLLKALRSDEEFILRSAATLLGVLKARETVPQLAAVLSTEAVMPVRVSRWVALDDIYGAHSPEQQYYLTGFAVLYRPNGIGVMGPGTIVGTLTHYELRVVSIYRTEVQDALIAITGQNLGFDAAKWRAWAKQHRQ